MNKEKFYKELRRLKGPLKASQVAGIEAIMHAWTGDDPRHLAYMLATAWHETDTKMQPLREYGLGKGKKYGPRWYGRGLVQLTWQANYEKAGKALGVDLVSDPDKALDPDIAAQILNRGMNEGWFSGKKLDDYFSATKSDPVGARRIVNGADKARLIAMHYAKFLQALKGAEG